MKQLCYRCLLICCPLILASVSLRADTLAYTFQSALTTTDSPLSLGFVFSTNSSITINELGYFDLNGAPFQTPHTIGIFDSGGNLITSTTINAGSAGSLVGDFQFQSITPVTLNGGATYTIAATTGGDADAWAYGNAYPPDTITLQGLTSASSISIGPNAAMFSSSSSLIDPTTHYSNYTLYAGPNFEIADTTQTPEPASAGLIAAAMAICIPIALRRRWLSAASIRTA
jgi:hypothetical protein